jgi:hypothetical protein
MVGGGKVRPHLNREKKKRTEIPMLTKTMKDERDRMRRDTALLISKVLMMVCLAAGAGTVAVVMTGLWCSAA